MCTHRGNKLVWEDHPQKEVCGNARRFACKYHGWQFDPEGQLRFVNKEEWFQEGIDKEDYGLAPIACDIWQGFIFVNLAPGADADPPRAARRPFADGLDGYPFDELTETFTFTVDAKANWKIFLDAMVEAYHGNTLHHKLVDHNAKGPLKGAIGSHFEIYDRNAIWSVAVPAGSGEVSYRDVRPMEELFSSDLWGPTDPSGHRHERATQAAQHHAQPGVDQRHVLHLPEHEHAHVEAQLGHGLHVVAGGGRSGALRGADVLPGAAERVRPPVAGARPRSSSRSSSSRTPTSSSAPSRCSRTRAKTSFPLSDEEVIVRNMHRVSQRGRRGVPSANRRRRRERERHLGCDRLTRGRLPPGFEDLEPYIELGAAHGGGALPEASEHADRGARPRSTTAVRPRAADGS